VTIHEIAALSFFCMAQAVTFAAGVLIGRIFSRKDAKDDNSNSTKDPKKDPRWWHTIGGQ
jgi:hypothetical protein